MEVKSGYKQTEVGVIPEGWTVRTLQDVSIISRLAGAEYTSLWEETSNGEIIALRGFNIGQGRIIERDFVRISNKLSLKLKRSRLCKGDVVYPCVGSIGNAVVIEDDAKYHIQQNIARITPNPDAVCSYYLAYFLMSFLAKREVDRFTSRSSQPSVLVSSLRQYRVPLPPTLDEQRAIAEALSDIDALMGGLDKLIAKKRDLRMAVMQQLLTGKTRLPGFTCKWKVRRIAEIASPRSEKNLEGGQLPVLTCSKHLGFVDSLGFFKNQVFSKDLSSYKVIRRKDIGYPANHVEEGSIGLQDRYDVALVSPIYIVFKVAEDTNSYFLHRLLKLDLYRQKFKAATTSSVDRRGSLRWPAFSEIAVRVPSLTEQNAIAEVLADMDTELAALEQRREKTRALKLGMMQELLTGRTRLV